MLEPWPEGISDGLTLPCGICGKEKVAFDYRIDDTAWKALAPAEHRLGVICLPCLEKRAEALQFDFASALREVQFPGHGWTIVLKPERIVRWPWRARHQR